MAVLPQDLGPLPRGDRADELQQLSLTAYRAEVPQKKFLLREERTDDKGVDLSLELKVDGSFTNIRSQVQLKATDRQDLNADETFSLQVDVSNLNYLLSGTSPMYVLWIAPRKEFRYTWARDEARRLYGENPKWGEQRTVTLRFSKKLISDEWETVYDHIFREGQLHRKTHDSLAKVATSERVVVAIDADSMKVTDAESAYRLLSESGLAIVAAGYANLALAQAKLLRDSQSGEPRIHLVCGYAALTMGNYFAARGHLGQALAGRNGLSALDRYFLDALVLVCDYHLGRLTEREYKEMQLRLESEAPRVIASQLHLDRIIHEQLSESNDARRSELTIELRELVEQIQADPALPESVKLGARIALLHAEGRESSIVRLRAITRLQMRAGMGLNPFTPAKLASIARQDEMHGSVYHEASKCINEAVRLQNPLLVAEAFVTRAVLFIHDFVQSRFILASLRQPSPKVPEPVSLELPAQIGQALTWFKRAACTEGEVRATLLMADWLEITGQEDEARAKAQEILGLAVGLGYDHHVRHAQDLISGRSEYQRLMSKISNPPDMDAQLASASDDEIQRFASECLAVMEIPRHRLPVVERECYSMRTVAQEQMNWCRHLELQQDLRHTLSPITHYATDPARACVCRKHGHVSQIKTPDWIPLIDAFKRCYCASCPDRSPKGTVSMPLHD